MVMNASGLPALSITTAVVLAGGQGTRLRDTVPDVPKPMAPIGGRPFLEYQLDYWIAQGIREFILSVGYRHEVIVRHFGASYRGAAIRYAIEKEPLGTGGGLLMAAKLLGSLTPCLVLNGDTFFEVSLSTLFEYHTTRRSDWTFSLFRTDKPGRYMGIQVAADGRIESLRSATAEQSSVLINGGVYLIEPGILGNSGFTAGDKTSLEDEILPALRDRRARMFGYESAGQFIDIGLPQDYSRACRLLASR
jgi:D-glycero-alpha-D-manno-heptose 1-phosphate guanylyltransferase